jgi:nitrate reductase gamma subunit
MISLGYFFAGPFIYLAAAVFVCVTAYKIVRFIRMPRPFRWDLYPVPHRGPAGSKYQRVDFSQQKAPFYLLRELWEMGLEILLIKRLFINNLRLWFGTYALHAGIYLGVLWIILLIAGAIVQINATFLDSVGITYLFLFTSIVGAAALILGFIGSVYLLLRRCIDADLRAMSDIVSYLNLWLMIALFGSALAAWLVADGSLSCLRGQIAGLIMFKPTAPSHQLITLEFFFFGLFLMYLPFSRMLHFAAKYFFYHNIMWDDKAMQPGSRLERERLKELAYRLQWTAPHIKANRSWLEQVTDDKAWEGEKSE